MPSSRSRGREMRELAKRNKVKIFYDDGRFSTAKFNALWERAIEKTRSYNSARSDGSPAWELYIESHAERYFQLKYMDHLEFPHQPKLKTSPSKKKQAQEQRYEARAKQEEAWDREQREATQMFQKSKQMPEESKSIEMAKMNTTVPGGKSLRRGSVPVTARLIPFAGRHNAKPIIDRSNGVVKSPESETMTLNPNSSPALYSTSRMSTSTAAHPSRLHNIQQATAPHPPPPSHRCTALDLQQERRLATMDSNDVPLNPVQGAKPSQVEESSIFPRAALDDQLADRFSATHLRPTQDPQADLAEQSPTSCYRTDPTAFEVALEELIWTYSSSSSDDISMADDFCAEEADVFIC